MLTSDTDGWGAAGVPGAADELEKMSTGRGNYFVTKETIKAAHYIIDSVLPVNTKTT